MDLDVLETSFDLVEPRGDQMTEIFYANLFALAPALEPLFASTSMQRQRAMLFAALRLLPRSLRDLDAMLPALEQMGARHAKYGALPEHYPIVCEVLVVAMADVAGFDWELRFTQAWIEAFDVVATAMIAGAESALALAA